MQGRHGKIASGNAFELITLDEIIHQLSEKGLSDQIALMRWREIHDEKLRSILSETVWVRGEMTRLEVESQVDLVAVEKSSEPNAYLRVLAVYSIKVSLRERFQQDLFWAEKLRSRGMRFCFITLDRDGVLLKAALEGKLTSKQAKMAAALYDRVYLLTDREITHHSRVFRRLEDLQVDLELWLRSS